MRVLVLLLLGVAHADVSVPRRGPDCRALIDAAARKMVERGYTEFAHVREPNYGGGVHVLFGDGHAAVDIDAIQPWSQVLDGSEK